MSSGRTVDLLTLPMEEQSVKQEETDEYLSSVSPRHKSWDVHRGEADDVQQIYAGGQSSRHRRYAERVGHCSKVLSFARDPPKESGKQN